MTELSFLLELFLDPELPCSMRDKLVARIREVEEKLVSQPMRPAAQVVTFNGGVQQAPSTLAAMAKHGGELTAADVQPITPSAPPRPIDEDMRRRSMEAAMRARRNTSK